MFATRYADVFKGDENWQAMQGQGGQTYGWDSGSTYVQNPPYFEGMPAAPAPIADVVGARVLACSGTASPPTTSRPPARSRRTARPATT